MNKKEFIERLIDLGGCGAKPRAWERGWDDAIGMVIRIAEELDELELPVIPKFVAEWIAVLKPYTSLRGAFEYIAQRKRYDHDDELAFWVEEGNSEAFARAWLDGYTVESEDIQ